MNEIKLKEDALKAINAFDMGDFDEFLSKSKLIYNSFAFFQAD